MSDSFLAGSTKLLIIMGSQRRPSFNRSISTTTSGMSMKIIHEKTLVEFSFQKLSALDVSVSLLDPVFLYKYQRPYILINRMLFFNVFPLKILQKVINVSKLKKGGINRADQSFSMLEMRESLKPLPKTGWILNG